MQVVGAHFNVPHQTFYFVVIGCFRHLLTMQAITVDQNAYPSSLAFKQYSAKCYNCSDIICLLIGLKINLFLVPSLTQHTSAVCTPAVTCGLAPLKFASCVHNVVKYFYIFIGCMVNIYISNFSFSLCTSDVLWILQKEDYRNQRATNINWGIAWKPLILLIPKAY